MQRTCAALMIATAAVPLPGQQPAHKTACEPVEFHFEHEGAPPNTRHYVKPDGGRAALNAAVVIDGSGIARLSLDRSYDDTAKRDVIATLTPAAAATLRKETSARVDRHLAVLLGDTIIFYAIIASPTGPEAPLAMGVDRKRAESIVATACHGTAR